MNFTLDGFVAQKYIVMCLNIRVAYFAMQDGLLPYRILNPKVYQSHMFLPGICYKLGEIPDKSIRG